MEDEYRQHLKVCHHTHTGMLSLLLLWHGKRIPTASQGMSSYAYWYAEFVAALAWKENPTASQGMSLHSYGYARLVAALAWKGYFHSISSSIITASDSRRGLRRQAVDQCLALQSNLSSRIGSMQIITSQQMVALGAKLQSESEDSRRDPASLQALAC